ncbi:MAG: hypothetical protein R3297_11670, partial [Desulfobulbales bacterium]|nr:hypothetical protein [Desulfobulbales bacterium]
DFFQLVKSRLAKGGIVGQWLHGYKIDNRTIDAVLKTFSAVFPRARIFQMDIHDYIIIATDEAWQFEAEQFTGRLQLPEISRSLAAINIHTPEDLLLREMFSQFTFARMTSASTVPVNTDNTPVLEPMAEFGNFLHRDSDFMNTFDSRTDPDARAAQLLLAAFMEDSNMTDEQLQESINFDVLVLQEIPRIKNSLALKALHLFWQETPEESVPQEILDHISELEIQQIITHPHYRQDANLLSPLEAYSMLTAELHLWQQASSAFWQPDPTRLPSLFARYAQETPPHEVATLAVKTGIMLAQANACKPALTYLATAEGFTPATTLEITREREKQTSRCREKLAARILPGTMAP